MEPMVLLSIFIALSGLKFTHVGASCPNPEDLPVLKNEMQFSCARIYLKWVESETSCPTLHDVKDVDNEGSVFNKGWVTYPYFSLVVRPDCQVTGYFGDHYRIAHGRTYRQSGDYKAWTGFGDFDHIWSNHLVQVSCSCEYKNELLDCTPAEELKVMKTCDNSNPQECYAIARNGVEIGNSAYQSLSSYSAMATVEAGVVEKIVTALRNDNSTTTAWSRVDSQELLRDSITDSLSCPVEDELTTKIVHVVGRCGDTTVSTASMGCLIE